MAGIKGKSGRKRNIRNIQEYYNRQFDMRSTMLIEKLLERALEGDREALIYAFDRRIGKPKQQLDIDPASGEMLGRAFFYGLSAWIQEQREQGRAPLQIKGGDNGQEGADTGEGEALQG